MKGCEHKRTDNDVNVKYEGNEVIANKRTGATGLNWKEIRIDAFDWWDWMNNLIERFAFEQLLWLVDEKSITLRRIGLSRQWKKEKRKK